MFQIKNNQVFISRGEDAVYTRSVKRADKYNSPYIISEGLVNPRIRFSIKANKNDKEPILEYEGPISENVPVFESQVIIDLGSSEFPDTDIAKQVYRKTTIDSYGRPKFSYWYYDGDREAEYDPDNWKTYELIIKLPIHTEDTANLTPGTYYYDIALITRSADNKIEYSDQWLIPTEFVIGGSFGE